MAWSYQRKGKRSQFATTSCSRVVNLSWKPPRSPDTTATDTTARNHGKRSSSDMASSRQFVFENFYKSWATQSWWQNNAFLDFFRVHNSPKCAILGPGIDLWQAIRQISSSDAIDQLLSHLKKPASPRFFEKTNTKPSLDFMMSSGTCQSSQMALFPIQTCSRQENCRSRITNDFLSP